MNKIGFTLTRTSQGFSKLKTYNDGSWSSRVVDVRTYLGVFPDFTNDGNVLPFFSFDREGCLLGLLRGIPGRAGDNLCGWLYIPHNIAVTGAQLAELVEFVRGVLLLTTLTEVERELEERFSHEYPTYRAQCYEPSTGSKYAVRNPLNMEEILENRYQRYYKNYGVVFLADPALLAPDYRPSVDDLTSKPLAHLITVLPPNNLSKYGQDVSLVFAAGGRPFTSSVRVDKAKPLQLIMRRPGFGEVTVVCNPVDGQPVTLPASFSWSLTVDKSQFRSVDEHRNPIPNVSISINGKTLHHTLSVKENECEEAKVVFSAPGYKQRKIIVNLLEDLPVTETLYKEVARTGGGGYIPPQPPYDGPNPWKIAFIGFILLILCGGLSYGAWWLWQSDEGSKGPEHIEDPRGSGGDPIPQFDTEKIEKIKKLPTDKWHRQELGKVGLEELWDALNEYRIDELTDEGEWGKLLREAGRDDIVNAAEQAKKLNVKHDKGHYNSDPNDFVITLDGYVQNLPKQPEPEKSADPVKKKDPVKPADPVKKKDPVKPADPVKKKDPVKPADPVKKKEPVKQADPVKKKSTATSQDGL